mgnify:CR=1 FL=1
MLFRSHRRDFLAHTATGLGGIALASMLGQRPLLGADARPLANPLAPKPTHFPAKAKNIIFLFMAGGPSQLDLFDPKPKLNELDGKPLPNALVALHPRETGEGRIVGRGQTDADGKFRISTYDSADGAPEGDYRVTIVWHKLVEVDGETTAGPNLLPAPYAQPGSTELRVSVKPGPNELSPLQIRP